MKTVEIKKSGRVVKHMRKRTGADLIRVTDHGKLVAYILPAAVYDEEDIGYMTDPNFWMMIEKSRISDAGVPLEEVMRQLEADEKKAVGESSRKNGSHAGPSRGRTARNGHK